MPLTALLILDDADFVFALLGVSLIEFQIRQAKASGATHVVLLVGKLHAPLIATIDRMRREGLSVDIARTVNDAIDFVHPDDRVILVAPRTFVLPVEVARIVAMTGDVVLSVAAEPRTIRLEIIDAGRRWTGWATFAGRTLREIGAIVGDWALGPTVLRHLLQAGATVIAAEQPVSLLEHNDERSALEGQLRKLAGGHARGAGEAALSRPLGAIAARLAGDAGIRAEWLNWASMAAAVGAAALALYGLVTIPAALMIAARIGFAAGHVLNAAITPDAKAKPIIEHSMTALLLVILAATGVTLWQASGQWGCVILALGLAGLLALLKTPLTRPGDPRFLADCESSFVFIAASGAIGAPLWGLALATLHAAGSVAARQLPVLSPKP